MTDLNGAQDMSISSSCKYPILVVDDDAEVLESFELLLNSGGFSAVLPCQDSREVMPLLAEMESAEVIVLDLIMPYLTGQELLPLLSENYPEIPVIVITATDQLETAVECMKAGAFDYLVKPVEKMRLISSVRRAIERRSFARENRALKKRVLSDALEHPEIFSAIVTRNAAMMAIFRYIEATATSPEPVLITGETGAGKELIAQAIHALSGLQGPFVAVNVAGLDDQNFSDVLFGHRKGAFTGADSRRDGLLKTSAGGTLFLDEIGDLSQSSQIKLLRLLQENEYFSLGSDLPQKSSARILAASNHNLHPKNAKTPFRRDLYYRLQTHQVHLPPLRQRLEDLPLLVDHFMEKASAKLKKKQPRYPDELISLLGCHSFPGNIRELQTMILDAVGSHQGGILSLKTFRSRILGDKGSRQSECELEDGDGPTSFSHMKTLPTLEQAGQQLIREAMSRANGNQSIASRLLGISQPALSRRLSHTKPQLS
jgi:DNA-binding NtrC family response regulator